MKIEMRSVSEVKPYLSNPSKNDQAVEAVMSEMSHDGPHISDMSQRSQMSMPMDSGQAPWPPVPVMALLSFLALTASAAIALLI